MRARFPSPRDLQDRFEERLREALPDPALDLAHTPLPIPRPDRSVPAAFAFRVLERAPDPLQLCAEVARVLRPGGVLLVHAELGGRFTHAFQLRVLLEHVGLVVEEIERFNVLAQPAIDGALRRVTRPDGTRGVTGRLIAGALLRIAAFGRPIDQLGALVGLGRSCVLRARKP